MNRQTWQRGAADLVSVGVGMLILAIVLAGTTASMVWGRDAITHQEHYKAAAYILRGKMEEVQMAMQLEPQARDQHSPNSFMAAFDYDPIPLDLGSDRSGTEPVYVYIHRNAVVPVYLPETGPELDYYVLTMSARWRERDFAANLREDRGKEQEIVFTTAFVVRTML